MEKRLLNKISLLLSLTAIFISGFNLFGLYEKENSETLQDYLNVLSKKQLIEYLKTKSFQLSRVISEHDMKIHKWRICNERRSNKCSY